jgi:hypothetical protein
MDEMLRKSTEGKKRGVTWRMNEHLEDLIFADDVCLLSQTFRHAREDKRCRKDKKESRIKNK